MLAEMEALVADKEGTLYRLEEENRVLEEGIEQVKAELVGALSEAAQAKNAVVSTEKEVQNLTRKLEKDTGELEAARQELCECEAKHGEAKGELEHSKRRRSDLNEEINEASKRVQVLEGALEDKDTVLAKLKDQLSQASSRLQSLRELEMNYEGYQQGVRSIMLREQIRGESKNGIVGLVSEFIETEPQYELAVESVLGERLQSVIVKSHGEGLEAIEFLKSEASGRGTFIPLSLPERRPHLSSLQLPTSFQERVVPLTRLVTAKAEVSRVTECLLGDVLLVDTLDDAFEIWNNHTVEHTLVTMDGEILDPVGIITGGARGSGDPGILQKKREIKELSEHIAQIRAQSEAASEERSQAFIDHSAAFENLNRVKQHLYETDIEALHKERDLEQLEAELNRLRRKIEVLEVEKRESESYLEEASVELDRAFQRREEHLSAQQAKESRLQALQEKARNRKEELHNVRKETLNAQLQLAQLREKADHSVATLERQRNSVSLVEEEHEVLVKRAQEERERITELKTLIEQGELELDHFLRESQKLTADLEEERRRAAEMDGALREKEERVKDFRRTLSEIQPELSAMNTRLAEINVTLSHLRQDMRDKYQVEVSDLVLDESLEPVAYDGGVEERLEFLRHSLESLGPVNPAAAEEYEELSSRHQFLSEQEADLDQSVANLRRTIDKISRITRQRFAETFQQVDEKFRAVFPLLFGGGEARLLLTDEEDALEAGIEIMAQPPGKKLQNIDLLSGGEKALTAIALLFALFMVKPSPFCLLDEADSALDDVNASRFSHFVKKMTEDSQFVLITHNKLTMEVADTLYGVTMEEPGVSKIVSVRLQ
jgi:chromosome segregation protein